MSEEKIIAHLFATESLSEVETYRIEEVITRYPYFALPRYWLARKQRWQQPSADELIISRTRLFAENPFLWLQYLETPLDRPGQEPAAAMDRTNEPEKVSSTPNEQLEPPSGQQAELAAEAEDQEAEASEMLAMPEPSDAAATVASSADTFPEQSTEESLQSPWIAPLYTRDYFAYAGITLPESEANLHQPTMAQVKSFTEWLRSTRRPLHSTDPDAVEDEEAEHPSEPGFQVITEAMANIWLQQGQPQKAIQVLEKLRLLNPEKSDYFAQRIAMIQNQS
ncbi:MAG: hypothetical protein IRZ29_06615 [Thermoflavifilum sp.]|nr:hypothetical protein [Thermoflavifilum sp.]